MDYEVFINADTLIPNGILKYQTYAPYSYPGKTNRLDIYLLSKCLMVINIFVNEQPNRNQNLLNQKI